MGLMIPTRRSRTANGRGPDPAYHGRRMPVEPRSGPGRRPRLLLYAMYDPSGLDSAPKVRIALLGSALEQIADVERIQGGRTGRMLAALRWWAGGGFRRIDAVYVESSTTVASPFDLGFLAWARWNRRPVGVYFRDAYQLFRGIYPRTNGRQLLGDLAWRASLPILRRLATVRYAPTGGLAQVLGLRCAVLLPPGGDPGSPDLGVGKAPVVAYVGAANPADGFDGLLAAMAIVRARLPDSRLVVVAPKLEPEFRPPRFMDHVQSARSGLNTVLASARVCVIPRPANAYTDLAMPVKLREYLALGKPVVATAARETAKVIEASGAGLAVADSPGAIAAGLLRLIEEPGLAESMGRHARSFALGPGETWDARAATVVSTLVGGAS